MHLLLTSTPGAGFIILAALLLSYMLPSFVAKLRRHRNLAPIVVTNLLLGWSVIGWLISFIWSLSCNVREK
jgi:hypothetical protein